MTCQHRLMSTVAFVAGCAVLGAVAGCTSGPGAPLGGPSSPAGTIAASTGNRTAAPGPATSSAGDSSPTGTAPSHHAAIGPTGHVAGNLTVSGLARSYHLYVPAKAASSGPVALMVALHGGGGSGAHFEQISGFDQLAGSNNFIVAYPDALQPPGGRVTTWNAGTCCGWAASTNVDDVGFIKALITTLSGQYRIDPARVYVTGHSNGGMLAYRIACQLAGTVAAIGVQSATLQYSPCHPSQPVSLLHIHGTADTQVPLLGGHGTGTSKANFTPALQAATTIATADGCHSSPTTGPDPTLAHAQLNTWTGCPTGIGVQFATVTGLAHTWQTTSATQIWNFLAAHPRPNR
ncbi:MAG: alpha/beta hydrolase family esterase [Sciscionella sp.]